MDLICINSEFPPETRVRVPNLPVKNQMYTIREMFPIMGKGMAVRLNEIRNPLLKDDFTGVKFEPSFSIKRFSKLDGFPPTEEEIKEFIKQSKTIKA